MRNSRGPVVEFCFDISCPFAYIASTRIEALASRCHAEIIWKPVLLGGIYDLTKAPQGKAGSAGDMFNSTKAALSAKSMKTTLIRHQIPFNQPDRHPQKTTTALRLIYWTPNTFRPQLAHRLFQAYWVKNEDVTDPAFLIGVAMDLGIPRADTLTAEVLSDTGLQNLLRTATTEAVERGAPGVPFFYVPVDGVEGFVNSQGQKSAGETFWGQDRMGFLEATLVAVGRGLEYEDVEDVGGTLPRCLRAPPKDGEQTVRMEFWYDFSSPWAYLGWTQLERIRRESGTSLEIVLVPMLLGALFKMVGAPNLPMMAVSEQKRKFLAKDQADWVRHWNAVSLQSSSPDKPIKLRFPDQFPIRTPLALRCAIAYPETVPTLYYASWANNTPISDENVLKETLTKAGFEAEKVIAKANEEETKAILRRNTDQAKELGLCGAPGYRVLHKVDGEWVQKGNMIWGQDNINVVQDLIAGWDEDTSNNYADVSMGHRLKALNNGSRL